MCHLIVSGFVQGVGYRQFVKKTALSFGLTGWVKNLDQGRVEALFYGPKEAIEKAINACRKGPFLADVKDIKIEWARPQASEAQADDGQGEAARERSDGGQEEKENASLPAGRDFKSFEILV